MKRNNTIVWCLVLLLTTDAFCQHLEAYVLGKALKTVARVKHKVKTKDKKAIKYGVGAVVKNVKGKVQKAVGGPMKLVGLVLGPKGVPMKVAGSALKAKSVKNKAKSGVLTVFKLSRDSLRYTG